MVVLVVLTVVAGAAGGRGGFLDTSHSALSDSTGAGVITSSEVGAGGTAALRLSGGS